MGGSFTRRQWIDVGVIASVNLSCAMCISLQAPIFPGEAERKGSSASEYGFVFGIYELVSLISCPLYGKYLDKIGVKKALNCGTLLAGTSVICFGLLHLIEYHVLFICLAFAVRVLEALGTSAAIIATYSITAAILKESTATTISILKGAYGLGFMIGPTFGGYIFQLGGFISPFATMGCLMIAVTSVLFLVLPNVDGARVKEKNTVQIFGVLKLLPVFVDLVCIVVTSVNIGFTLATLEPHIRQFELSPVTVGGVFMVLAGSYAVSSLLVGYLCGSIYPRRIIIFGVVSVIAGTCLMGPAPYLPVDTHLWAVCLGLAVQGFGGACVFVASLIDALKSTAARGLPNDMALYGVVSGLAQSAFCLGDTIGPSVGGLLYDAVGFRQGTLFLIVIDTMAVVAMTSLVCMEQRPAQKPNEVDAQELSVETDESRALLP